MLYSNQAQGSTGTRFRNDTKVYHYGKGYFDQLDHCSGQNRDFLSTAIHYGETGKSGKINQQLNKRPKGRPEWYSESKGSRSNVTFVIMDREPFRLTNNDYENDNGLNGDSVQI